MALELESRGEMKLALQYVPHPVGGMHCCFVCACQAFAIFVLFFFFLKKTPNCLMFFSQFRHLVLT